MSQAQIIDGKAFAANVREDVAAQRKAEADAKKGIKT